VSRRVASGAELVDVTDLCAAVAAQARTDHRQVDVSGTASRRWWGAAASLHEVLRLAVVLVTERTSGQSPVRMVIEESEAHLCVHVSSSADPTDGVEPTTASSFRAAVERLGVRVRPDATGPGGSGLVIELPRERG
jgi:hypothetical protein